MNKYHKKYYIDYATQKYLGHYHDDFEVVDKHMLLFKKVIKKLK